MNYILFDSSDRVNLLPFTFTRPSSEVRFGILTITEKWKRYLNSKVSFLTESYLNAKYPLVTSKDNMLINGTICPDKIIVEEIANLKMNEALVINDLLIAARVENVEFFSEAEFQGNRVESKSIDFLKITFTYDIFAKNGKALTTDFEMITRGRTSQPLSPTNRVVNPENIFIEEGAVVEFSILNASTGPIYIGTNSEVMEGALVRGPFALLENATLKLGAKIYGPTTVGPHSKVGGEVNNSVFFSYSNKGHDGFVGNSVIGEWCNIGADTNTSNLKNTYDEVKLWSYDTKKFEETGLTFCGLMMGDHSKSGINTMFNTGTVVGVASNVFGAGFPRNFIPSFSWGGSHGFVTHKLEKAFETALAMRYRRNLDFDEMEKAILKAVYNETGKYRYWERK
ncbi:MAG: GlmU family protein [Bacteroidia bacterium]